MIISRYDIRLLRIKPEHLELIRYWRNSEKIKRVMEYQGHITETMQWKWYKSLDIYHDFYFVIEHHDDLLGLIHISQIDWKLNTAQSGLFIWDDHFLGTPVPLMASVNLLDTFVLFFQLQHIEAKVKHNNINALSYNKFLGFSEMENSTANQDFIKISLEAKRYAQQEKQIKSYLEHHTKQLINIQMDTQWYQKFLQKSSLTNLQNDNFKVTLY